MNFVKLPKQVHREPWYTDAETLLCYVYMLNHCRTENEQRKITVSVNALANALEISTRQTKNAINNLLATGYITNAGKSPEHQTNIYAISELKPFAKVPNGFLPPANRTQYKLNYWRLILHIVLTGEQNGNQYSRYYSQRGLANELNITRQQVRTLCTNTVQKKFASNETTNETTNEKAKNNPPQIEWKSPVVKLFFGCLELGERTNEKTKNNPPNNPQNNPNQRISKEYNKNILLIDIDQPHKNNEKPTNQPSEPNDFNVVVSWSISRPDTAYLINTDFFTDKVKCNGTEWFLKSNNTKIENIRGYIINTARATANKYTDIGEPEPEEPAEKPASRYTDITPAQTKMNISDFIGNSRTEEPAPSSQHPEPEPEPEPEHPAINSYTDLLNYLQEQGADQSIIKKTVSNGFGLGDTPFRFIRNKIYSATGNNQVSPATVLNYCKKID